MAKFVDKLVLVMGSKQILVVQWVTEINLFQFKHYCTLYISRDDCYAL